MIIVYNVLNLFLVIFRYHYYIWEYEAFIGLTDLTLEGEWSWNDGSVTNYLNFDKTNNEPNNWQGMEDCVTIKSSGNWSDRACSLKKSFVCKQSNGKHFFFKERKEKEQK